MKCLNGAVMAGILMGGSFMVTAQDRQPAPITKPEAKQQSQAPTADQAKNNLPDRELMQQIRKAVMDDKTLSTRAHNVKIIARNGKVTLKGPVDSAEEKKAIEQKATEVAGAGNVTNEIMVKASRVKKTS